MPQTPALSPATLPVVILDQGPMPETLESLASDASPKLTLQVQPDMQAALQAGTEAAFVLIILSSLETALVAALGDGMSASEAIIQETERLEEQLAGLRPHRRKILILERSVMQADPAACATLLSDRLGCGFGKMAPAGSDPAEDSDEAPAERLIARLLIHESGAARRLADELEASMDLPAKEGGMAGIDRLQAALLGHGPAGNLSRELELREAEVRVLLANVAELEEQMREDSLELGLQQSRQSGMAVEGGRRTAREEILGAALLRSLGEAQRGREAEALLNGVYHSTSWRLTAPIRTVRRSFRKP